MFPVLLIFYGCMSFTKVRRLTDYCMLWIEISILEDFVILTLKDPYGDANVIIMDDKNISTE